MPEDLKDLIDPEVAVAVRDDLELHPNLIIPKGVKNAPIIFFRTPNSAGRAIIGQQPHRYAIALPTTYAEVADAGYNIAVQNVRDR